MKEFVKVLIVASLAGAVTAVLISLLNRPDANEESESVKTVYLQGKEVARSVDGLDELLELRKSIVLLRQENRRLQQDIDGLTNGVVHISRGSQQMPRKSYINRLEKEDPERHKRILERLQDKNRQTEEALADSAEFLFNLDMSAMTPEQAQNHQKLLDLLEDSWKQLDIMKVDPRGEDAQKAKSELRSNVMAMRKAYETERQTALEQWCQWKGISPDQAAAARAEIEAVYEQTDPSKIIPGTRFVGENVMITVVRQTGGKNSQTIMMNMDASFNTE